MYRSVIYNDANYIQLFETLIYIFKIINIFTYIMKHICKIFVNCSKYLEPTKDFSIYIPCNCTNKCKFSHKIEKKPSKVEM